MLGTGNYEISIVVGDYKPACTQWRHHWCQYAKCGQRRRTNVEQGNNNNDHNIISIKGIYLRDLIYNKNKVIDEIFEIRLNENFWNFILRICFKFYIHQMFWNCEKLFISVCVSGWQTGGSEMHYPR